MGEYKNILMYCRCFIKKKYDYVLTHTDGCFCLSSLGVDCVFLGVSLLLFWG